MGPVFRRKTLEGDQKSLLSHPPVSTEGTAPGRNRLACSGEKRLRVLRKEFFLFEKYLEPGSIRSTNKREDESDF